MAQVEEKSQGQESKQGKYYIYNVKYEEDEARELPLIKSIILKWFYLPLFRFFYFKLKFPVPSGINSRGEFLFHHHQGFVQEKWQAELAASKYKHGGWHLLSEVELLPEEIVRPVDHGYANISAKARNGYAKYSTGKLQADFRLLASKLAETDKVMAAHKARAKS